MQGDFSYVTDMSIAFDHFEIIDTNKIVDECPHKWYNRTLTSVNQSLVRIGIVEGEFHWHKHENDDEFFFVLEGKLIIELENGSIELTSGQGVTISKGVMHRPIAPAKTVMLMVESNAIIPTGD